MSLFGFRRRRIEEPDEFQAEVLHHLDALYAVAYRLTRNETDAEDLVQDTVFKAMRGREQFSVGTNLKAWLFKILTNTFINKCRRGGLEREIVTGPESDALSDRWVSAATMRQMSDPESNTLRLSVEREIIKALDELPEEYRVAVMLSDVEDFSYREIAEVVGCPIGTVMSRLHRGRRMLQRKLYDQAVSLGIVAEQQAPQPSESAAGSEPSHGAVGSEPSQPVALDEFRARRRGANR